MRSGIKRLNCYRTFAYKSSSHFLYMNCNTEWAFGASITKKTSKLAFNPLPLWLNQPTPGAMKTLLRVLSSPPMTWLIDYLTAPTKEVFSGPGWSWPGFRNPFFYDPISRLVWFWSPTLRPTYREKGQKKQARVLNAQDRRKRRMQLIAIKNDRWGKVVTIQCWGTWIQPWLPSLIGCSLLRRFLLDFLYL